MLTEPIETQPRIRFADLKLIPPLQQALDNIGYVEPSAIQSAMIPVALTGRDVIGQAQTGTGKTAAFLLPFMNSCAAATSATPRRSFSPPPASLPPRWPKRPSNSHPASISAPSPSTAAPAWGSNSTPSAQAALSSSERPGACYDHISRGTLRLDKIRYVVLDEADRMLDIGFRPQIEKILRRVPSERQTMLMSATVPSEVLKLTSRYMRDPEHINVSPATLTVDKIDQKFISVEEWRKLDLLIHILARVEVRQSIIFVERKRSADQLHKHLKPTVAKVHAIHGDMQQSKREKIMAAFRTGKIKCLIATDVMSRGIDVSGISHIINYDLPLDFENYVHRIGRTGRMGADGIAISFVTPDQGKILTGIEMTINRLIPEEKVAGFEPAPRPEKPEPKSSPHPSRRGRRYVNRL